MLCLRCSRVGAVVCPRCSSSLRPASPRFVVPDLVVGAAFQHAGVARQLVHDLKYRGMIGPAAFLAPALADLLPARAAGLVPVPRARNRRIRFGVDPALELARAVGRLSGLPVLQCLRPPLRRSHHAGKGRDRRAEVRFVARRALPHRVVIVDDVITTGATLAAARAALGEAVLGAIVATSAGV